MPMKITFIGHSCFSVEYDNVVFIFDYYKGKLPNFSKDKKIYVFASHRHFDHFTKDIFTWISQYPNITYILSDDIKAKGPEKHVVKMGPNEERGIDQLQIKTLRSTDEGVAFFITYEDKKIYHAGDLNWWHWEEEPAAYNEFMKRRYQKEIDKIKGEHIDVAFVPVDPRLGKEYYWGLDWFMKQTDTKRVFPMHMQGAYGLYNKLLEEPETKGYREQIVKITGEQECW